MSAAQQISDKLKAKGILTYILSDETKNIIPNKTIMGVISVGVWVVMDYQYEDAERVLENPDHVVVRPLSPVEMKLLARDQRPRFSTKTQNLIKWTVKVFFVVVIICVVGYFLRTMQ